MWEKQDWQHIPGIKTWLIAHLGKQHFWQHILGKKHDWHHILGKKHDW
jgi:hypothetical protein